MGNVPWDGMRWDSTHCISHGTYATEIDEQEIQNLLNEHSDAEYECQNDNQSWAPATSAAAATWQKKQRRCRLSLLK